MLHKKNLLIVAGAVWLIAGINVLRIGILTYQDYHSIVNYLLSVVVFLLFHFMVFSKLVKKHTARMLGYEREKQPVYAKTNVNHLKEKNLSVSFADSSPYEGEPRG